MTPKIKFRKTSGRKKKLKPKILEKKELMATARQRLPPKKIPKFRGPFWKYLGHNCQFNPWLTFHPLVTTPDGSIGVMNYYFSTLGTSDPEAGLEVKIRRSKGLTPWFYVVLLRRFRWKTLESHNSKQMMVYEQIKFFLNQNFSKKLDPTSIFWLENRFLD